MAFFLSQSPHPFFDCIFPLKLGYNDVIVIPADRGSSFLDRNFAHGDFIYSHSSLAGNPIGMYGRNH